MINENEPQDGIDIAKSASVSNASMANRNTLGGVIHTYQRYDPKRFPSPTQPPLWN